MPGLGSSYAITVDKDIRERFQTFMEAGEFSEGHLLAYIGAAAAYMHGAEWLEQMLDYIKENIDFTEEYLKEAIQCYKSKYGICAVVDNYIIYFEPFAVMKMITAE